MPFLSLSRGIIPASAFSVRRLFFLPPTQEEAVLSAERFPCHSREISLIYFFSLRRLGKQREELYSAVFDPDVIEIPSKYLPVFSSPDKLAENFLFVFFVKLQSSHLSLSYRLCNILFYGQEAFCPSTIGIVSRDIWSHLSLCGTLNPANLRVDLPLCMREAYTGMACT